jgi:hypothetical protein
MLGMNEEERRWMVRRDAAQRDLVWGWLAFGPSTVGSIWAVAEDAEAAALGIRY